MAESTGLPSDLRSRQLLQRFSETWKQVKESYPYFPRKVAGLMAEAAKYLEAYQQALREEAGLPSPEKNEERVRRALQYP